LLKTRPRFLAFTLALTGLSAALNAQTVRFQTTLGGIDVVLTPSVTPLTVANFMAYVNSGAYTNTIFHRSLNSTNSTTNVFYLIQGGGYALGGGNLPVLIPQSAPVTNEFKASNTRGTLAMAQYAGDINSATDQWYFNTSDNSGALDTQSFTVFGSVANSASLAVMDAINALPTYQYNAGQEANFTNLPLQNYVSGLIRQANYIFINSIAPISPSYTGLANAATALPNSTTGISPGEILTLYGKNMGPTQVTTLTLDPTGTFVTTSLEGTQVLFNGVPGAMIFTADGQIAVVAPYEIAGLSTVSVVVSYLGVQTNPLSFNVVPANPGLFTLSQTGKGDAAIVRLGDSSVIGASNPASPGDTLELYGQGYGVASPGLPDGTVVEGTLPQPAAATTLLIDSKPVSTIYAGGAGGEINGILQVNFVVPQLAPGSHQIQVQVGSVVSPAGVNLQTH
jgi:uncharacterized protein (TIGR03437 family)